MLPPPQLIVATPLNRRLSPISRFMDDFIYTYIGPVLISVNP